MLPAYPAKVDFAQAACHLIASVDLGHAIHALRTLLGALIEVELGEIVGGRCQLGSQRLPQDILPLLQLVVSSNFRALFEEMILLLASEAKHEGARGAGAEVLGQI